MGFVIPKDVLRRRAFERALRKIQDESPPEPDLAYEVGRAWPKLIRAQDWGTFGTVTFRHATSEERADKRFRPGINKINRRCFGTRRHGGPMQGIQWIRCSEFQRRGVIHFHFLLGQCFHPGFPQALSAAVAYWRSRCGRTDVTPYSENGDIGGYMMKSYLAHDLGEVDLGGAGWVAP
ncbi:MAG: rolling circle replication-associated protein [Planctomycetota bacterium]|jgi:hypothetical protein